MLGCIGLGFVAVFVTVAFWGHQPLVALGVFCALFLGLAAWCAGRLSQLLSQAPAAFGQTISEFRSDWRSITPGGVAPGAARTGAGDGRPPGSAPVATGAGDESGR